MSKIDGIVLYIRIYPGFFFHLYRVNRDQLIATQRLNLRSSMEIDGWNTCDRFVLAKLVLLFSMQQRLCNFIIHRPQAICFFSRIRMVSQERVWVLVRVIYKCLCLVHTYQST